MSIKVKNLSYIYSPKTPFAYEALNHIDLDIQKGSFTAIVGHTGSGKSTLIQHFNALLLPYEGSVEVEGYYIDAKTKLKNIKLLRSKVGIVFQFPEYQLFESTVEKDVMFGPKNFGMSEEDALKKAHEALQMVGIDESYFNKSPFDLSGGEKRRVAIAGILAMEPKTLILDEPTAGLDPQGIKEIMSVFKKINERGVTIILVSHDMDVVLEYASDVIVLENGSIKKQCSIFDLFNDESFANYSLEIPKVLEFAQKLIAKGFNLDLTKIKNVESLAAEIARKVGDKQ